MVVTAYGVAMGGLLLSAGRLADVVGARRTFLVATAAFALTSLACAWPATSGSDRRGCCRVRPERP